MGVRRWTLLVLALAGCLRETSYVCRDDGDCGGGRCEANGACSFTPAGLDARPGIDADLERDRDGDQVPDVADNCRDLANPTQHDEDQDDVGDLCDNCPHVANVGQLDIQELVGGSNPDGVGDACDPSPAAPGNRIVFFDGFEAATAGWEVTPFGTWSVAGDALHVDAGSDAATVDSHRLDDRGGVPSDLVLTTSVLVTSQGSGPGNAFYGAGPVASFAPIAGNGAACVAGRQSASVVSARLLDLPIGNARASANLDGEPALVGRTFDVRFEVRGNSGPGSDRCTVTGPADEATAMAPPNNDPPGSVGLLASRIVADFAYIVVISD